MSDDTVGINVIGVMLDNAGVAAALQKRVAQIAGELDRVRIDCELPALADTLSRSARELLEHTVTALENPETAPSVVPGLLTAFDALIRDLAMVESSNDAEEGFPTSAQGRALLRYLLSWVWFLPPLAAIAPFKLGGGESAVLIFGWVIVWALLSRFHSERQFWRDAWAGTRLIPSQSMSAARRPAGARTAAEGEAKPPSIR